MANVSEVIMTIRCCAKHSHLLHLTQLHLDIIYWLARGFSYKNIACKLKYSYGHVHNSIGWLYANSHTCDKISFLIWVDNNKILIEKNGEKVLNEELMLKKESG